MAVTLFAAASAVAQTPEQVLLVINDASEASVQVGAHYARQRALPTGHIVHINTTTDETIQRPEYEQSIEAPIARWLEANSLQDTILYVVLTKGVPLRIVGTAGRNGTYSSVDSELSLLYRRLLGMPVPFRGPVDNPYYLGEEPVTGAGAFSRSGFDIYLVSRLDGFTVEDAIKLIDRGLTPSRDGRIVLDRRAVFADDRGGDRWLLTAADRLELANEGSRVLLEDTRAAATSADPVLGFYSWGSNDPSHLRRQTELRFSPGAIAGSFVSSDGRTFLEPPDDWTPGPSNRPAGLFGSGSQSLAGDLIREGVTGVSAHVAEPYLDAAIRPQILFPAYLSGFSLVESYYLAMPYLSWQTLVIGDPLCAPFRASSGMLPESPPGLDPDTELPAIFAERRLEYLGRNGLDQEALKLSLRAGVYQARGDHTGADTLLAQAVELEPRLTTEQLYLASRLEARGEYAAAVERYRRVLEEVPDQTIALNNLAYALAVHLDAPDEALPYAERAARISPIPAILDTLGWTRYLRGDHRAAADALERAIAAAPDDVEMLVHAATVHAELGELTTARRELDRAVTLSPEIADRPDVRALRARIGGLANPADTGRTTRHRAAG